MSNKLEAEKSNWFGSRVYFIRHGSAVKIGYSTDVHKRKASLQTASPGRLELLGTMPADRAKEREIHQLFHSLRLGGEWFSYTEKLKRFIVNNCDRHLSAALH